MARTNVQLLNTAFLVASGASSGASTLVSAALDAPADFLAEGGRLTLCVHNPSSVAPLHVEVRAVWTDVLGQRRVSPLVAYYVSNTQGFGGSAAQAQATVLLVSGQGAALTFTQLVGQGVEVAVMPAAALPSTVQVAGTLSLWWS